MAFLVNPPLKKMHIFLVFLVLTCTITGTTVAAAHNRRTLHQPFFPHDTPVLPPPQAPAPAPAPTPTPPPPSSPPSLNVPFLPTPSPNNQPFFQSFPSPPPPPPSPLSSSASFPANISSLSLPASPKPKRASSKLVPVAVTLAIAAIIVLLVLVILRTQKRKTNYDDSQSFSDEKPERAINDSGNKSYNRIPKLNRPSKTSSEFLYLGTIVNSHGGIDGKDTRGDENHGNEDTNLGKIASPELRPLPPLSGSVGQYSGNQTTGYETSELESRDEEFYSPRASDSGITGGRPAVDGNYPSRRGGGSRSSSSYTSSSSDSPARSISLSISPPASLSPRNSRMKSPDLVAIHTAPPPSRPAPPPPPLPRHRLIIPPPDVGLSKDSLESSPRFSNSSNEQSFPPAKIPPPPPPPPANNPPPAPATRLNPPVLIKPSRTHIPPLETLPENQENLETAKPKLKLKPLHWDKVRASSDREMVWDHLKSSSFKLNEERIETLFIVKPPNPSNLNEKSPIKRSFHQAPIDHENQVLDPKRSQNISIALRALNVTAEDVCAALLEGNVDALGTEILESLLKMVPTKEEERKLKDYQDDSPYKLGPAEKFLKTVVDVPFAFKRIGAMLYVSCFESEVEYLSRSFQTLDAACEELRNNRMFLKLLEAVLKTGNRMNVGTNRGDAQAFKLDTLLKLIDVKSADGKTTLLHFVVQEITRTEGARVTNPATNQPANGLQTITNLCTELSNVKKAAGMDYEVLKGDVVRLSNGIDNTIDVVQLLDGTKFSDSMTSFLKFAQDEVIKIQVQERDSLCLVKEITEYFHGNSAKEEAHPLRIFMVVRDFLRVLDMVCKEVRVLNDRMMVNSGNKVAVPVIATPVFDGFQGRREYSSSDDESSCSL